MIMICDATIRAVFMPCGLRSVCVEPYELDNSIRMYAVGTIERPHRVRDAAYRS